MGVGVRLLREYILRLESATKNGSKPYERILLITHAELRIFYENAGFEWLGKSEVVHGAKPWFEMRKVLERGADATTSPEQLQSQEPAIPPGLWDALQRPPRNRPTPHPFTSFSRIDDVCAADPEDAGNMLNKFDILCPREECGSVILKAGVAKWVERASVQVS